MGIDETIGERSQAKKSKKEIEKFQAAKQRFHDYYVKLKRTGDLALADERHYQEAMKMERNGEVKPLVRITSNSYQISKGARIQQAVSQKPRNK